MTSKPELEIAWAEAAMQALRTAMDEAIPAIDGQPASAFAKGLDDELGAQGFAIVYIGAR